MCGLLNELGISIGDATAPMSSYVYLTARCSANRLSASALKMYCAGLVEEECNDVAKQKMLSQKSGERQFHA